MGNKYDNKGVYKRLRKTIKMVNFLISKNKEVTFKLFIEDNAFCQLYPIKEIYLLNLDTKNNRTIIQIKSKDGGMHIWRFSDLVASKDREFDGWIFDGWIEETKIFFQFSH